MEKPFAVNAVNGTCKVLCVCVQARRLETPKVLTLTSKPCPKNVLEYYSLYHTSVILLM